MRWNSRSVAGKKTSNESVDISDYQDTRNPVMSSSPLSDHQHDEESNDLDMSSSGADVSGDTSSMSVPASSDGDRRRYLRGDDDDEPDYNSYSGGYASQFDDSDVLMEHPMTRQEQRHPDSGSSSSSSTGPVSGSGSEASMRNSMCESLSRTNPNTSVSPNSSITQEKKGRNNSNKNTDSTGQDSGYESPPPHPALFTSDSSHSKSQHFDAEAHQQLPKSASDTSGLSSDVASAISSSSALLTNPQTMMDDAVNRRLHMSEHSPINEHNPLSANSPNGATTSLSSSHSISNSNSSSSSTPPPSAAVIEDDDPGLDHALPPDECAGSLTPSNVWRPQNQQSTCEFTHTIKQYSQKRESGCKKAEYSATTVDVYGNRWRLIVYVNGNGRASNHHLSLFLQVSQSVHLYHVLVLYLVFMLYPSF